jgi:hypothetical protein
VAGFAEQWDPDADLLIDLVRVVDRYLERVDAAMAVSQDPDAFGEFDRGEHVIGLGFVACQTYLAAACARSAVAKRRGLELGPRLVGDATVAALVNYAANHWKHRLEPSTPASDAAAERRAAAFAAVGIQPSASYPLGQLLALLAPGGPGRFERVLPSLFSWRREVCACRRTSG